LQFSGVGDIVVVFAVVVAVAFVVVVDEGIV